MHSHALEDKAAAYELQTQTVCIGPSCVGERVQWLSHMHVQRLRNAKDQPCAIERQYTHKRVHFVSPNQKRQWPA